jgi:hypothetical protein
MAALLLFLTFGRQCPSLSQLPAALGTSLRLLLVPLICIPVAVIVSLSTLKLAALLRMPVNFVTPALVGCTVVAISIDYSLFLLAAFAGGRQQASNWRLLASISENTPNAPFTLPSPSPPPIAYGLLALPAGRVRRRQATSKHRRLSAHCRIK